MDNLSNINSHYFKDTIAVITEKCCFYMRWTVLFRACWLSRFILVSRSREDRAEGLADHIICLFGVHACLRKLFLSVSLPLHVNNSPYCLPLKFSRVEGGARRICSGCWTKVLLKHAAINEKICLSQSQLCYSEVTTRPHMVYRTSHKYPFCPCPVRARTRQSSWYQSTKRQFDISRSALAC